MPHWDIKSCPALLGISGISLGFAGLMEGSPLLFFILILNSQMSAMCLVSLINPTCQTQKYKNGFCIPTSNSENPWMSAFCQRNAYMILWAWISISEKWSQKIHRLFASGKERSLRTNLCTNRSLHKMPNLSGSQPDLPHQYSWARSQIATLYNCMPSHWWWPAQLSRPPCLWPHLNYVSLSFKFVWELAVVP